MVNRYANDNNDAARRTGRPSPSRFTSKWECFRNPECPAVWFPNFVRGGADEKTATRAVERYPIRSAENRKTDAINGLKHHGPDASTCSFP